MMMRKSITSKMSVLLSVVMLVVYLSGALVPAAAATSATQAGLTKIVDLTTNYKETPLGVEHKADPVINKAEGIVFGWKMESCIIGQGQKTYQITVADDKGVTVWDSGVVESGKSVGIQYKGSSLKEETRYIWTVTVTDIFGDTYSEASWFETGADWTDVPWITVDYTAPGIGAPSGLLFRTEQELDDTDVASARLYMTALGIYQAYIDGKKALLNGRNAVMAPGAYENLYSVGYQTYDVTDYVNGKEKITLGAFLGNGWYGVNKSNAGPNDTIGDTSRRELCLLAKLVITFKDGTRQIITTNNADWKVNNNTPLGTNGIQSEGETYSGITAKALAGWNENDYNDMAWSIPVELTNYAGVLFASDDGLAYDYKTLDFVDAYVYSEVKTQAQGSEWARGEVINETHYSVGQDIPLSAGQYLVLDFGINCATMPDLTVSGPAGAVISIRPGENLYDGITANSNSINIQGARGEVRRGVNAGSWTYTLGGSEATAPENFRASHHFGGNRYLQLAVTGGNIVVHAAQNIAITSVGDETVFVETSSKYINQFVETAKWSHASNYISTLTDCPTREYTGWTGDANVFAGTAVYNFDVTASLKFYNKMMQDQNPKRNGGVASAVNAFYGNSRPGTAGSDSAGWSDAGVVVPWEYYLQTGDESILEYSWNTIDAYVRMLNSGTDFSDPYAVIDDGVDDWVDEPTLANYPQYNRDTTHIAGYTTGNFGDHNGEKVDTSPRFTFIATADIVYNNIILSKVAEVLGKTEDAAYYAKWAEDGRQYMVDRYIDSEGNVLSGTADVGDDTASRNRGDPWTVPVVPVDNAQTAISMMLLLGCWNEEWQYEAMAANLSKSVRNENRSVSELRGENTLAVGFRGADTLMPGLARGGQVETAYALMLNDEPAGLSYSQNIVKHGALANATSCWEVWLLYKRDYMDVGKVNTNGWANGESQNHYAFGAPAKWIYKYVLGIDRDEANPGFKNIILQPQPFAALDYARGSYDSYYGAIESGWIINDEALSTYNCTVPANTTATLYLPVDEEDMDNFNQIYGVTYLGIEEHNGLECAKFSLFSGGYNFDVTASGLVASHGAAYFVPVQAEINSAAAVGINTPASFTVSLTNANGVGVVTFEFTVDSRYLDLTAATALNGFSILDQLSWEYIGSQIWKGSVKLYNPGFVQTNAPIDVLEISGSTLSLLGATTVTLTDIVVTGDVHGFAGTLPCVIVKAGAETSIVSKTVFSKYDLNHDGRIDELDLAIVVYYYLANDLEADWAVVKFDIASAKDCDVAVNGRVDLADMIEVIANYCDSY